MTSLPTDAAARKAAPLAEGLLWYFPNALAEVAKVSKAGNDQHNSGSPLHHDRDKSGDHADCILRHLVDAGKKDSDGQRHTAKVAWRALALLQEELEREEGCPLPRNATRSPTVRGDSQHPMAAEALRDEDRPVFKKGDRVRVARKVTEERGWENSWVYEMDDAIGEEGTVSTADKYGVYFTDLCLHLGFPPSALERV